MDDEGKQPHACGSGQQRTQHPRPFFYVQPPSQPYVLYHHWQMNNPYGHYGLPGGFNFPRPYMPQYPYMQYPGYVYPHAPIYPMDHRRMFEPRFHAPPWGDMARQQHHPYPQDRREMACSEAQTDPSDAITKLIECLDKIRSGELQGAEREMDSGVASQSSGMFSPGEDKKGDEQGQVPPTAPDGGRPESPAVFSDSTTAVYDAESSHRSLDTLSPQGCWPGGMEEEELPLGSSSVHGDSPEVEEPVGDAFLALEGAEVTDIQPGIPVAAPSFPSCDADDLPTPDPVMRLSLSASSCSSNQPEHEDDKSGGAASKTDHQRADEDYQILKLPFDSATPGDAGASRHSSPAASYFYNYLSMRTTHERMSVLSPSLDELSSRDEMFSTDLDDSDLFPQRVYTGRRLAEVVGRSPRAAEAPVEPRPPGPKRPMCSCCGKSLAKAAGRSKGHCPAAYGDDAGDSEDDGGGRYGRGCEPPGRAAARKHPAPRKPHPVPPRHAARPWYKRGQYKDPSDGADQEEGRDLCTQEPADDGLCRDDATATDPSRWGDGDVIPRRRQTSLQRQEMNAPRKVMYHRPRGEDNDDDEPPPLHWERGSMRESRC